MLMRSRQPEVHFVLNHAYARECLRQAETAEKPEAREKLIELSRVWIDAALREEKIAWADKFDVDGPSVV